MPTSTHPTAQTGMPPRGGGRTLLQWVSILHRRGGRPCPPAENARFYGDLMRNRNILKGRCGHRPLQTATKNSTNFEGGQSRPPLQKHVKNRTGQAKNRRAFLFCAVGVDAYLGAKSRALRGCASKLACGRRIDPSHRPNRNAPARGGRTLLHWVSFLHRRGGRLCPPAENARFFGDLMRNRNILKGRCGHRPLRPASQNAGF